MFADVAVWRIAFIAKMPRRQADRGFRTRSQRISCDFLASWRLGFLALMRTSFHPSRKNIAGDFLLARGRRGNPIASKGTPVRVAAAVDGLFVHDVGVAGQTISKTPSAAIPAEPIHRERCQIDDARPIHDCLSNRLPHRC
jgi:hypothetical protein